MPRNQAQAQPQAPADDLEAALLPEGAPPEVADDPYFSLENVGDDPTYFALDDDGRDPVIRNVLTGEAACQFLGIPVRPHFHLKRGDYSKVYWKFKPLFDRWMNNKAKFQDPDRLFWKNIKVRVWNKANLEKLSSKEIVGKRIQAFPLGTGLSDNRYAGEIYDGSAFSTFLSETANAHKYREYFLQLVSVTVTEDMQ